MRRTFATLAIKNGAPTRLVQIAGRWKNIREVERYTRALDAADLEPYSPVGNLFGDQDVPQIEDDDREEEGDDQEG